MMTIEELFFTEFAIAKVGYYSHKTYQFEYNYPRITADRLLKLICILADSYIKQREFYKIKTTNVEMLKGYVLGDCIDNLRYLYDTEKENFISLVRETFKEYE